MANIVGRWPRLIGLFVLGALSSSALPTHAGVTKTVTVTGMSAVYDGDLPAALEQAKRMALRTAVEGALGVLISARTRVSNFAVIDDDILSATQGYVRTYQTVGQRVAADGSRCEVTVQATVDLGDLHADLRSLELLWEESGRPRLVCVGGEYVLSDTGSSRVEWGVLCRELAAGLAPLGADLFQMDGLPSVQTATQTRAGDPALSSVGGGVSSQHGGLAEILLVATASLEANRGLSVPFGDAGLAAIGIQSVVAEVAARAQWSDTGRTLASSSATGRGADTSFRAAATAAIADAVPQVATELGAILVEQLRSRLYDGRLIELRVTSENARQLRAFESGVGERLGGVERLFPRTRAREATYAARSKTNAFALARELTAKGLGDVNVEIVNVTPNTMVLQLSE